jgi:hypothetical protein
MLPRNVAVVVLEKADPSPLAQDDVKEAFGVTK